MKTESAVRPYWHSVSRSERGWMRNSHLLWVVKFNQGPFFWFRTHSECLLLVSASRGLSNVVEHAHINRQMETVYFIDPWREILCKTAATSNKVCINTQLSANSTKHYRQCSRSCHKGPRAVINSSKSAKLNSNKVSWRFWLDINYSKIFYIEFSKWNA